MLCYVLLFGLILLLSLWVGIGEFVKVFIIVFVVFYLMIIVSFDGLCCVDLCYVEFV